MKKILKKTAILLLGWFIVCCHEVKNHNAIKICRYAFNESCKKESDKKYIPKSMFKLLDKCFQEEFKIANLNELAKVNLTDAIVTITNDTTQIYDKVLNFVLICDNNYLISFEQGGFAHRSMLAYFSMDTLKIYENSPKFANLKKLENFLCTSAPLKIIY